ncbi:hypothetical protein AMJ85_09215 [candidate division BRC1 bacterium SM23_51]|nr:MAG: hypothetical protein AMJ85_09215 [candidate division BRC1 bacterium SM23_51]
MYKGKRIVILLLFFIFPVVSVHPVLASQAATSPTTTFVFVPYDRIGGPQLGPEQSVLLPYAEFLRLKDAAATRPEAPEFRPLASISRSSFNGVIEGDVARIDAEFVVETLAQPKDPLEIHLPFTGASVESVAIEGAQASVGPLSTGSGLRLFLRGGGRRVLRLRLAAPVRSEGAAKRLDFHVPRAAASSLSLRLADDVTLESVHEALPATVSPVDAGGVEIKASCGSRDRVLLVYRPRTEVTGAAAQTRIAVNQDYRLSVAARSVNARVRIDVSVLAGSAESVTVQMPPSVRLLSVSGSFVKDWQTPDKEGKATVALVRPVARPFDLTFDVQIESADSPTAKAPTAAESFGRPPVPLVVPELRVPGAARETGTIIVAPDSGLSVWPEEIAGLEAVSVPAERAAARAFRFAQPGWKLVLSRRPTPARVRADGIILYEVTEKLVRLKSRHRLAISDRGIFDITFQVPEKYELREAGPSELVSGFRQQGRQVAIIFRREQHGGCEVDLSFQRPREPSEGQIQIEPIEVIGADEDAGSVVLAMPLALRATERESDGLEAIDVRALLERLKPILSSDLSPVLGYRYFRPTFRALASVERRRTRLTCETARLASIMPSLMRIDTTLDYNVEFSATDEFQLLVPASAGEDVRFSGADIKEKIRTAPDQAAASTDTLTTWTVRLQRRVLGPYRLSVSFDTALPGTESGEVLRAFVPVVRATHVARETGFVAVSRGENLEVRVARTEGLEPRDVKELPPTLASASLGFRYFDPEKQSLELELIRHELESVLGGLIRRMHLDTVLNDQRRAVHEVFFEVQNNRQQYLELRLPEGMEIWSAFVRGVSVRPTIRQSDGARLVELTGSGATDKAFRVRMILRETLPGGALGTSGKLTFTPPEPINMPVLRTTWKLYLPRDYRYIWFGGTMRHETGGHVPWIEPAAESLLNDIPARMAGGIARPTLRPPQVQEPISYETAERQEEKSARLQGVALDIQIVREGLQFQFSKLSGVGSIEAHYWERKPLILLQGAVAILLLLLVLGAMGAARRLWIGIAVTALALIAASLTEGLAGRLLATAFASSGMALVLGLLAYAIVKVRSAGRRVVSGPQSGPPSPPPAERQDEPDVRADTPDEPRRTSEGTE